MGIREKSVALLNKLKAKYRLVILNDTTLEEKISFRLSRLNVFVLTGSVALLLIFITTYIIAFTPLREYIPGYTSVELQKQVYSLQQLADSLETDFQSKDLYINNLKRVLSGDAPVGEIPGKADSMKVPGEYDYPRSEEDSLLRAEIESMSDYSINTATSQEFTQQSSGVSSFLFFTPVKGFVSNDFDPRNKHYGIDIVSRKNEPIKATLDGRVIFAGWTLETGYVISIQHKNDLVSFYKHNSTLLREQGAFVRAGEAIAIIGETGELSTGPHLHFELWFNGSPVDPKEYISF
jgi:murein DD-endopeptidase MepM/ murein hydrolase activator NlpD